MQKNIYFKSVCGNKFHSDYVGRDHRKKKPSNPKTKSIFSTSLQPLNIAKIRIYVFQNFSGRGGGHILK